MPDGDVIDRPPSRAERRSGVKAPSIHCEFCECKLSLRGRILWRSDKAKAILLLDEEADKLRTRIEAIVAENTALKAEVAALKDKPVTSEPTVTKKRTSWTVGEDEA